MALGRQKSPKKDLWAVRPGFLGQSGWAWQLLGCVFFLQVSFWLSPCDQGFFVNLAGFRKVVPRGRMARKNRAVPCGRARVGRLSSSVAPGEQVV